MHIDTPPFEIPAGFVWFILLCARGRGGAGGGCAAEAYGAAGAVVEEADPGASPPCEIDTQGIQLTRVNILTAFSVRYTPSSYGASDGSKVFCHHGICLARARVLPARYA